MKRKSIFTRCTCGFMPRSSNSEARHRHNFPILCKSTSTARTRVLRRFPDAHIVVDRPEGCRPSYQVQANGRCVPSHLVYSSTAAWNHAEHLL